MTLTTSFRCRTPITTWTWLSSQLTVQHYVWVGTREYDSYTPARHYNLHVQPLGSDIDYHNYHIRYLGKSNAQYRWSVVDAPYGYELSARVYDYSKYRSVEDAVDIVSALAVTDITNDIGDFTLWVPLYECLWGVMMDLFNWDRREPSTAVQLRSKNDCAERATTRVAPYYTRNARNTYRI